MAIDSAHDADVMEAGTGGWPAPHALDERAVLDRASTAEKYSPHAGDLRRSGTRGSQPSTLADELGAELRLRRYTPADAHPLQECQRPAAVPRLLAVPVRQNFRASSRDSESFSAITRTFGSRKISR